MPPLRLRALSRNLHASHLGRPHYATKGVLTLRETHDDMGEVDGSLPTWGQRTPSSSSRAENCYDAPWISETGGMPDIITEPQIWLLAARPGMGKSHFALSILADAARRSRSPCLLLKSPRGGTPATPELVEITASVEGRSANGGNDMEPAAAAQPLISKARSVPSSPQDLVAVLAREAANRQSPVIGIDTIQSVAPPASGPIMWVDMLQQLQRLTRSDGVSLLVLSQADARPESYGSFRPTRQDIRLPTKGVGLADLVLLLHCEDHYWKGDAEYRPTASTDIFIFEKGQNSEQRLRAAVLPSG